MKLPQVKSHLEDTFAGQLRQRRIPFQQSVKGLVEGRKWEVDFLLPGKIVVEVEGGTFKNSKGEVGRHVRGLDYERDQVKYNTLEALGYHVFRATSRTVKDESMADFLQVARFEGWKMAAKRMSLYKVREDRK